VTTNLYIHIHLILYPTYSYVDDHSQLACAPVTISITAKYS